MNWQRFLNQLNAEFKDIGADDPPVEVFDANTGKQFAISHIYNEDGVLCIDITPEGAA
jgi:hypothetical protein